MFPAELLVSTYFAAECLGRGGRVSSVPRSSNKGSSPYLTGRLAARGSISQGFEGRSLAPSGAPVFSPLEPVVTPRGGGRLRSCERLSAGGSTMANGALPSRCPRTEGWGTFRVDVLPPRGFGTRGVVEPAAGVARRGPGARGPKRRPLDWVD